jgi:hypothetical protein
MWLPKDSGLAADLYLAFWWAIEGVVALNASSAMHFRAIGVTFVALLVYRLIDVFSVLFSILLKGYYRDEPVWLSGNRMTLLTTLNAVEIMFIFGLLFYYSATLWTAVGAITPPLAGLFDAFFLSVVTGTTLGYGVPAPSGPLSKALAMVETLFLVLVVIVLISNVRSQRQPIADLEQNTQQKNTAG